MKQEEQDLIVQRGKAVAPGVRAARPVVVDVVDAGAAAVGLVLEKSSSVHVVRLRVEQPLPPKAGLGMTDREVALRSHLENFNQYRINRHYNKPSDKMVQKIERFLAI